MPVVTIIVSVYNRPELLKRALSSLLAQKFTDWECIIVDDGSTDATPIVAQEFVLRDSRLQLIQLLHTGASNVINAGIQLAKGKYITILDSDDEYSPTHLELRVSEMEKHPTIDVLHGGMKVIGDSMVLDKNDLSKKVSLYDPNVYVGGTFFGKREVFIALNGFRKLPYAADSDFLVRAIQLFQVQRVSWPTYLYHRDHESSWTKNLEQMVEQMGKQKDYLSTNTG